MTGDRGGTVLLVIDVQRAFFGTEPPPYEGGAVIDRINRIGATPTESVLREVASGR